MNEEYLKEYLDILRNLVLIYQNRVTTIKNSLYGIDRLFDEDIY